VAQALERAVSESPSFAPAAPLVKAHCSAIAKTVGTPRPDLTRAALPEAAPDISPELRAAFDEINEQVRAGTLDSGKAGAAYMRAIAGRL
jgi:hypothetical protein